MTTLSNNRSIINGDIDTGRGQLGIGWAGTATAGPLWSLRSGANHYAMTSATTITLVLPDVGTGATQAQPGYWFTVKNTGTNTITFNNFAGATINALAGGVSAMYIAVATSFASSNWVVQYDTTTYGAATTLQQAYNASGNTTQIILNSTNGAVKIQDAATPIAAPLFNVLDTAAASIFRVGALSGAFPSSVALFGGNNSALRTFVVGNGVTVSGAGSTILSDSTFTGTYSGAGILYQLYAGGSWAYGGSVQEGTTKTSPNRRTIFASAPPTAPTTGIATISTLVGTVTGTTYRVTVTAYGRDTNVTSAVSATHIIEALITNLSGTATVVSQQLRTIETAGYTNTPSNAVLSTSGANVVLTLTAPDNISGGFATGSMDYRVVVDYCSLTE